MQLFLYKPQLEKTTIQGILSDSGHGFTEIRDGMWQCSLNRQGFVEVGFMNPTILKLDAFGRSVFRRLGRELYCTLRDTLDPQYVLSGSGVLLDPQRLRALKNATNEKLTLNFQTLEIIPY